MKDVDCIFCKIANGEIPSATVYEDEGHALVLPKEHWANLFELPDEVAQKGILVAKKVAGKLRDALGCDGFNIVQNNGTAAGQTVFHFHIHLIPRYENDQAGISWTPGTLTEEDKKEILSKMDA